ncbi:MAG: hypothetical protein EOQ86_23415 [Mesorhizobium sp.]|uniref:hypothetical protein n=1 Tax=Mesorhizobium sp. TaxID=1871066 RepID=UPI000FE519A2|nr:hypothetical protein [Mesorhizobium sp.]RWH75009.1 MAG: hypothetical protein EOQ85_24085 [Mesorhizobium sp.]RWH79029.1 MAG: hypothetical protein EOQ86_23415 [Mesorhizobium sp.]RWH88216.1 MAG: hypothetical protein EOQ87_22750 [Mesorhizobium sp.]RWH94763.1 MAG: hypothetical protein EOQ88_24900 [Mesorhizobium sp.]RWH98686.1 MAG: hypothetical protein EOQ89_22700 [Mesorhizobium sp.]
MDAYSIPRFINSVRLRSFATAPILPALKQKEDCHGWAQWETAYRKIGVWYDEERMTSISASTAMVFRP